MKRHSRDAADELAARGVRAGSRVAIDTAEPADVLTWFLGADALGAATLVLGPAGQDRASVLDDARPDVVVSGRPPVTGRFGRFGSGDRDPGELFYLPTTSGSSGRAKVLARTRESWLRSFRALGPFTGPVLVPGPLSSSLFLFGALHALWCGSEPMLRTRLRVDDAREAAVVHLVPAMLHTLVAELERDPAACALRTVVCGGAHVPDDLRRRFARVLPDAELVEYYGSAEHSLIAVRRTDDGLRPVPEVETDVRDGVLWVRSPLAFSGYLRGGELECAPEWSTVGDRVELTDTGTGTGTLTVRGRGASVVASGGSLVSADEVEAVLRRVPGVRDVLVAGTPHTALGELVTAVIELPEVGDDVSAPSLPELRAAARTELPPASRPRRWLTAKALPRTASGKLARAHIAERLREGTLPAEPLR